MILGPKVVLACPKCGNIISTRTLISSNTIFGKSWTDGYGNLPMLPATPGATRCVSCHTFFWIYRAHKVGEYGGDPQFVHQTPGPVPIEWENAAEPKQIGADDCLAALDSGLCRGRDEEIYLCMTAWHRRNHRFRNMQERMRGRAFRQRPIKTKNNIKSSRVVLAMLERLLDLLNEQDSGERLAKAEILRELERFEEALQLLEAPFPKAQQHKAKQIRDLAIAGVSQVQELKLDTSLMNDVAKEPTSLSERQDGTKEQPE